jgi:hypothetical protein
MEGLPLRKAAPLRILVLLEKPPRDRATLRAPPVPTSHHRYGDVEWKTSNAAP